jgi:hypothetical protein
MTILKLNFKILKLVNMLFEITNRGNEIIMSFAKIAKFYLKDIEKEVEFYANYKIHLPDPEEFYRKIKSFYDPIPEWMLFGSKISRYISRSTITPFQFCFKIESKKNYYIDLEL